MGILGSSKILSLDFGTDSIKAVEGKHSGKGVIVDRCFKVDLPKGLYVDGEITDMDQMTYLLRTGLSENKVSQLETYGVFNSSSVVMREVKLPKAGPEEIEAIINYQLEDYIPINPEDYVVKYLELGTIFEEGVDKMVLLLVGIPRNTIQAHLTLLRNVNLKPTVLDYHGNAIGKLLQMGGEINNTYGSLENVACIDIGSSSTSVSIIEGGLIKVARVVERGMEFILEDIRRKLPHLEDDQILEYMDEIGDISQKRTGEDDEVILSETLRDNLFGILDMIEMIFRYYKTRDAGNKIDLVVIYGGLSKINGMDKLFKEFFDTESTKLKSLEKIKADCDMSQYANAIGGLIRLKEVKKK
ncbi:pilus assembly protein PilM [Gudongella sp. SC589]|uniref:pilus assembly protein PilM n=1 Tax=Gudongella sp. SC589 TaxID=3385990 RepID=UPI003904B467